MSCLVSFAMSCSAAQNEWKQCLHKGNKNPSKCLDKETVLRKCAAGSGENFCVDETVNLLKCANSGSSTCGKEFILVRECKRVFGPQLVPGDQPNSWNVVESGKHLYENHAISTLREPRSSAWNPQDHPKLLF
jgi:hypothetical protein